MKRNKLRLATGIVAAVAAMVSCVAPSAFADVLHGTDLTGKTQTITVNAGESDISNAQFKAVPLAYYSNAVITDNVITGYDLSPAATATTAAIYASLPASAKTGEGAATEANPMVWVVNNLLDSTASPWAGELRDFLDNLKNQPNITATATGTQAIAAGNHSATISGLQPGVYAVFDTAASGKAAIVGMTGTGIGAVNTLQPEGKEPFTLGEIEYKVHDITVSKGIVSTVNGEMSKDINGVNGDTLKGAASAEIGDHVTMQLDTQVPNWTGYDKYYFALNDTYNYQNDGKGSASLKFLPDTVVVKVGDTTVTKGAGYSVVEGDNTFTIKFGNADGDIIPMKDNFEIGAPVTVTYEMLVTGTATSTNPMFNKNEVEYSHNPNTWTDHEVTAGNTAGNEVQVYTGRIDVKKTDMDGNALAGAKFNLLAPNGDVRSVVKTADGKYRLATEDDTTGTVNEMEVASDGTLRIEGVSSTNAAAASNANNGYTLKETASPFNVTILPEVKFAVQVNPETGAMTVVKGADTNKLTTLADNIITVKNFRNLLEMPKTGATWLSIMLVGAAAFLIGGSMIIFRSRKQA